MENKEEGPKEDGILKQWFNQAVVNHAANTVAFNEGVKNLQEKVKSNLDFHQSQIAKVS